MSDDPYRTPAILPPPHPPWSGSTTECTKCGHRGSTFNRYNPVEDRMHRKCMDCGYGWTELTLDALPQLSPDSNR